MNIRRVLCAALLLPACGDGTAVAPRDAASLEVTADVVDVTDVPDVPAVLQPLRATAPFARYVNPLQGSGGDGYGTGSTFPGAQRPFGLARPGPDTSDARGAAISYAHCAGYAYFDTHCTGFSQLHMHGAGIVDYGVLAFMPTLGMSAAKTRQTGYLQPFQHARETAEPGFYRVTFDGSEITTEVTATDHVALYRVTFPRMSDAHLLFDLGHVLPDVRITAGSLEVDAAMGELRGSLRFEGSYSDRIGGVEVFWVARSSRPLTAAGTWNNGVLSPMARTATGTSIGAYVPVDARTDNTVTVAIGLSLTDLDHARRNLMAEAADLDFDRAHREATAVWEPLLARVQAEARGERALRTLYSSVYHTLQMPTLVSDVDGTYRGVDRMIRRAEGFRYYSDLSLWDTYRTEHPWLSTVYPEYQRDFVRSIIAMAEAAGYYPRWPLATGETGGMLGDPGALMVADSWLRGVRDFDVARAWSVARQSAFATPTRRERLDEYMSLRYVAADMGGSSAALTMEYAYADGALANWARGLGHTADADTLARRAENYRNLWDPAQRFFVGRRRDGSFLQLSSPETWQPFYAEGGAWQYLWFAPQDIVGLATLMGGREMFLARLDELYTLTAGAPRTPLPDRFYWQGNEPDIHAPWIASAFDDVARASRFVDWVRVNRYGDGPDGLPGNDDGGTMSAWYAFAALGMYPIAGTNTWLLAAPSVTSATVRLASGATLRITAPGADAGNLRPRTLRWNGEILPHPTLTQAQVGQGGELAFEY